VNLLGTLLSQSGRPHGWFGRILVRGMNLGHSGLTRWGLMTTQMNAQNETRPNHALHSDGNSAALHCHR